MYHELSDEGKHREKSCAHLQIYLMTCYVPIPHWGRMGITYNPKPLNVSGVCAQQLDVLRLDAVDGILIQHVFTSRVVYKYFVILIIFRSFTISYERNKLLIYNVRTPF